MFTIICGQEGDDYVYSECLTLQGAKEIANRFLKMIEAENIPTYVYILTPEHMRINPPFNN